MRRPALNHSGIRYRVVIRLAESTLTPCLLDALNKYPGGLPLEDIKLLPADSDLLKALRSAYSFGLDSPFRVDPEVHLHVGNATFGGHFVRYLVIIGYKLSSTCPVMRSGGDVAPVLDLVAVAREISQLNTRLCV